MIKESDKQIILQRILQRIVKNDKGCWIWQGPKDFDYGIIYLPEIGDNVSVHRVTAWIFRNFDFMKFHFMVLHKPECNNPSCCNPDHTYEGTQLKNMRDRKSLGNYKKPDTCKRGHQFTYTDKRGKRRCKECHNMHQRIYNRIKDL